MNITINTTWDNVAALKVADLRVIVKDHDLVVQGTGKTAMVDAVWFKVVKPKVEGLKHAKAMAEAAAEEAQRLALLEDASNDVSEAIIEGYCANLQKGIERHTETINKFKERVMNGYGVASAIEWNAADAVKAEELVGHHTRYLKFFSDYSEYTLAQKIELVQEGFLKECRECLSEGAFAASCTCPYTNVVKASKFAAKQQWTKFLQASYKSLVKATQCTDPKQAAMYAANIYVW